MGLKPHPGIRCKTQLRFVLTAFIVLRERNLTNLLLQNSY